MNLVQVMTGGGMDLRFEGVVKNKARAIDFYSASNV